MPIRILCPTCGKSFLADPQSEPHAVVCTACGGRVTVPGVPGVWRAADPSPPAEFPISTIDSDRKATPDGTADASAAVRPGTTRRRPLRIASIGIALLAVGGTIGFFAGRTAIPPPPRGNTASFAADEARNADLLLLKSEAEALAIAGRLEEAHAKYRQMTGLASGREFHGPLLWDILERAKVDQDRVYWILLSRMDGAERAFGIDKPLPGLPNQNGAPATLPTWRSGRPLTSPASPSTLAVSPPASATGASPALPAPATRTAIARVPASSPATAPASRPTAAVARIGDITLGPVPIELTVENPAVLDGQVDQALRKGASFLLSQFNKGELPAEAPALEMHRRGLHALIVYALLSTGHATNDSRLRGGDPNMSLLLTRLKSYPMETDPAAVRPVVYSRSFRAAALSVLNRPEDRLQLKDDVDWLTEAHVRGGFSYDDKIKKWKKGPGRTPNVPPPPAATQPRRPGEPPRPGAQSSATFGEEVDGMIIGFPRYGVPLLDEEGRPIMLVDGGNHDPRSGRGRNLIPMVVPEPLYVPPPPPRVVVPRVETLPPGYDENGMPMWDNSNSQIAVLGVASGAGAGVRVPPVFWQDVRKHWFDSQHTNGQWSFRSGDNLGSIGMTAGGSASLLHVNQFLPEAGSKAYPRELDRALAWLDQADNAVTIPGPKTMYIGYDLFAVGRAGLLSGYKYFGSHDWYRKLAGLSVSLQNGDGSWGTGTGPQADRVVDTAFHMLFLARGRHPIMMNKLRWEGQWNRRPRDLANAANFLSTVAERPMNWQTVRLDRAGTEWLDAPILYIGSDEPPAFNDADYDNLRRYVQSGGMLFLHADDASFRFGKWAQDLCKRIAPDYPAADIPPDHDIYSVLYKLPPERKRLQMVSNGSRPLVLIAPYDISAALQAGDEKKEETSFQLMANIWAFANGRTNPRPRLDVYDIPPPPTPALVSLNVVRLKYEGNWNPEPGSWPRFSRYLHWETGAVVSAAELPIPSLTPGLVPMAHLTGTGDLRLSDVELAALRDYVNAGGVLLIDACGGSTAFRNAVEQRLLPAFPNLVLVEAPDDQAPIINSFDVSDDLRVRGLRPYVAERDGVRSGKLQLGTFGKGRIVYSPLDLSTGLAGSKSWGVSGYSPDYSIGVVKNVLLWATVNP